MLPEAPGTVWYDQSAPIGAPGASLIAGLETGAPVLVTDDAEVGQQHDVHGRVAVEPEELLHQDRHALNAGVEQAQAQLDFQVGQQRVAERAGDEALVGRLLVVVELLRHRRRELVGDRLDVEPGHPAGRDPREPGDLAQIAAQRLARPDEYAQLALAIVDHDYLNGEVIRMDGSLRMAPR